MSLDFLCASQAMAEQLAENYHNTWGRKKKQELEAKGEGYCPLSRTDTTSGSECPGSTLDPPPQIP